MKSKKKAVAGLLCVLAISSLVIISCGDAMPQTFMDEVRIIRDKSKPGERRQADEVEFHDLVAKYIPVGTRKGVAVEFCKANGFNIIPVRDKRDFDSKIFDESVVCSKRSLKWYLISEEEIRVILHIKNGVVAEALGFIF